MEKKATGSTMVTGDSPLCPVPAGRYALVLPEITPRAPATITVTIAEHGGATVAVKTDNKIERNKVWLQGSEAVRMIGPCGGTGGEVKEMVNVAMGSRLVRVVVRESDAVDAITVFYGREEESDGTWGGGGGRRSEFDLRRDEYLTSVEGYYGEFKGPVVVRLLTNVSNLRKYGPYGKKFGVPFALPVGAGEKIVGFHARSGGLLDAIGTYVGKIADD